MSAGQQCTADKRISLAERCDWSGRLGRLDQLAPPLTLFQPIRSRDEELRFIGETVIQSVQSGKNQNTQHPHHGTNDFGTQWETHSVVNLSFHLKHSLNCMVIGITATRL